MKPRHFIDTNVLLYSISTSLAEYSKRERAIELLQQEGGALSIQVLQEFYVQATRPSRTSPITHDQAVDLISSWMRFYIQENTVAVLEGALELKAIHGFSFWDSAILSAARALGCRKLYSEDMSHGRVVEGVEIENPFR